MFFAADMVIPLAVFFSFPRRSCYTFPIESTILRDGNGGGLIFNFSDDFVVVCTAKWVVGWIITEIEMVCGSLHFFLDVFSVDFIAKRIYVGEEKFV